MNPVTVRQAVRAELEQLAPSFDPYRQFHGQALCRARGGVQDAACFMFHRISDGDSK